MSLPNQLLKIFQCIDQSQEKLLERLRESLNVSSLSHVEKTQDSSEIFEWIDKLLNSLGFITNLKHFDDECSGGLTSRPSVIFGTLETAKCPNRISILIYSHLATCAIDKDDTQSQQTNVDIHGKDVLNLGATIAWLNAIEAFKNEGIEYPVDIKFIIAPLESETSAGLKNLLICEKDFLDQVDYVCMSEGSWLQSDTPIFVKKLRGICYFSVEVQCSKKNMESDICTGIIRDAMNDLLSLLGSLTDENKTLSYSELGLQSEEFTQEEIRVYEDTDLDVDNLLGVTGAKTLMFDGDKSEIIKHRLMHPNVTIHSIENSLKDEDGMDVAASAVAKLSVRSFHDKIDEIFDYIKTFLEKRWAPYNTSNILTISLDRKQETWKADVENSQYKTAIKAAEYAYQKPLASCNNHYTIPVVTTLQEIIGRNLLLLPITSENGYMSKTVPIKDYINASKMFGSYFYEMGLIPKLTSKSSTSFVSCESVPEICVCGKFEETIPAASGDSDSQKPKLGAEDEKCVCPYRSQVQTKDVAIISDDLIELNPPAPPQPPKIKPCKCVIEFKTATADIVSMISTASTASRDPTPQLKVKEAVKKNITPSLDTLNCACTPNRFKTVEKEGTEISPEREEELKKSMRFVGSEISGISGCKHLDVPIVTPNMKIMGCMCPERSQMTVCDVETQKDRMFCPVQKGKFEICNKGGKRKHHIAGPPPMDEDESEITLGPLSHCSCSGESIVVVRNCDCPTGPAVSKNNMEDEID